MTLPRRATQSQLRKSHIKSGLQPSIPSKIMLNRLLFLGTVPHIQAPVRTSKSEAPVDRSHHMRFQYPHTRGTPRPMLRQALHPRRYLIWPADPTQIYLHLIIRGSLPKQRRKPHPHVIEITARTLTNPTHLLHLLHAHPSLHEPTPRMNILPRCPDMEIREANRHRLWHTRYGFHPTLHRHQSKTMSDGKTQCVLRKPVKRCIGIIRVSTTMMQP